MTKAISVKELQIDLFNYHRLKLEIPTERPKAIQENPYIFRKCRKELKLYYLSFVMNL